MKTASRTLAAHVLAVAIFAAPRLTAQTSVHAAVGVAVPVLASRDSLKSGYSASIGFDTKLPVGPFGVRFEGLFGHLPARTASSASRRFIAGIADVTVSGTGGYLIGGMGLYNGRCMGSDCAGSSSANDVGANVGVGVAMPLSGLMVQFEARLHMVINDSERARFVPITFAIAF